jgi:hypothetical protein
MSDALPQPHLDALLPVLAPLARHVAAHGEVDDDDLTDALIPAALDRAPWAAREARVWAAFLLRYRSRASKKDKLVRALRARGVPEESARLAADRVVLAASRPAASRTGPAAAPAPITCLSAVVALGERPAGVDARATLRVAGGPGTVEAPDDVAVSPLTFGPGTTRLELTVAGRSAGQSLCRQLVLRAGSQVRTVEVVGSWVTAEEAGIAR